MPWRPAVDHAFDLAADPADPSVGLRWSQIPADQQANCSRCSAPSRSASYVANFDRTMATQFQILPDMRNVGADQVVETRDRAERRQRPRPHRLCHAQGQRRLAGGGRAAARHHQPGRRAAQRLPQPADDGGAPKLIDSLQQKIAHARGRHDQAVIPLALQVPAALAAVLCATRRGAGPGRRSRRVRRFARHQPQAAASLPPMTVLKPLHGDEPLLDRSAGNVLPPGLSGAADWSSACSAPTIPRSRRAGACRPVTHMRHRAGHRRHAARRQPQDRQPDQHVAGRQARCAGDRRQRHARGAGLSAPASPPLAAATGVGLVTTLYAGLPATRGVYRGCSAPPTSTRFSAAGAVLARALGRQDCLGATMALRATPWRASAASPRCRHVADDGVLGRLVRGPRPRIALAATVPATTVAEQGLAALFRHELRWARTIRAMAPAVSPASLVQYPLFWALLAASLAARPGVGRSPCWRVAIAVRAGCGRLTERALAAAPTPLWLAPLRDLFSVAVMAAAYAGAEVAWRDQVLSTQADRPWCAAPPLAARPRVRARLARPKASRTENADTMNEDPVPAAAVLRRLRRRRRLALPGQARDQDRSGSRPGSPSPPPWWRAAS